MVDWTAFISPAIVLVGGAIGYGKLQGDLTGRIKGQEVTLLRHENTLDEHTSQISELELSAAESRGFREGLKYGSEHQKRSTT